MDNNSTFSERLKELLFDNKITTEQLAEAVKVARSTAYRWTIEPYQINRVNLIAVADYFRCSIDFLSGRSDDDHKFIPKECPNFYQQLRKVMEEKGFTTYTFKNESRFDTTYLRRWKKGEEPMLQTLIDLAKLFDCTIDYLVGRE